MKAAEYLPLAAVADQVVEHRQSRAPSPRAKGSDDDPDDHRNAPRPDAACLHGFVGEIVRADTTEANPHAVALNALAYLGCCLGRGPYLPIGNTYHHARLFGMHVGRSGRGRKGDAVSLIHRIDRALRERRPDMAPQVHRGGLSSREGLAFLMHDGYREGKNEVPAVLDKRLWVIESEFANVLHQTKRDGNTLSAALRDCWDGVSIKPATKSNRISATDPHVSMSVAVTSTELLSLIEQRELSNGFANRFLMIFAERARLIAFPQATPQDEVDGLAARLAQVLEFVGADGWAERDKKRVSLSPTAAKQYEELYLGELNRLDFGPLVTGLLERRAPVLLRIAMIFALTDETTVIEPKHIDAALAWVRYWTDSVRFIFSSGAEEQAQSEVSSAAAKILAFVAARGRQSRTQINAGCFHGKLSRDRLDAALQHLLLASPPKIAVESVDRADGPGSPTKFYDLAAKSAKSAERDGSCGVRLDSQAAKSGGVSAARSMSADLISLDPPSSTAAKSAEERASIDGSLNTLNLPMRQDTEAI